MLQDINDQEILNGLLSNNSKIIEVIYDKYFNLIFHFIRNNGGSLDEAKDIFQDTILILYDKVHFEEFELTCQLKTFIYSICKNLWLKKLNQQKRATKAGFDMNNHEIEGINMEILIKKEKDFYNMNYALKKIGEPCKSLIEAYYFKKMDMQEIANQFKYSNADTAKNQKYKCLNRLKKYFFENKND